MGGGARQWRALVGRRAMVSGARARRSGHNVWRIKLGGSGNVHDVIEPRKAPCKSGRGGALWQCERVCRWAFGRANVNNRPPLQVCARVQMVHTGGYGAWACDEQTSVKTSLPSPRRGGWRTATWRIWLLLIACAVCAAPRSNLFFFLQRRLGISLR